MLGFGNTVLGRAGFKRVHGSFVEAFEGIGVTWIDLIAEGAEVAGHARFTARHRASGREVDFLFSFSALIEDGRFRRIRQVMDYTSLLDQLQLLEPEKMKLVFAPPEGESL